MTLRSKTCQQPENSFPNPNFWQSAGLVHLAYSSEKLPTYTGNKAVLPVETPDIDYGSHLSPIVMLEYGCKGSEGKDSIYCMCFICSKCLVDPCCPVCRLLWPSSPPSGGLWVAHDSLCSWLSAALFKVHLGEVFMTSLPFSFFFCFML